MAYGNLLRATSRVIGQAKCFSREIGDGVKFCAEAAQQVVLEGHRRMLDMMVRACHLSQSNCLAFCITTLFIAARAMRNG
jgi:hypothetical protein